MQYSSLKSGLVRGNNAKCPIPTPGTKYAAVIRCRHRGCSHGYLYSFIVGLVVAVASIQCIAGDVVVMVVTADIG
jgi:cytochrome c biogenesis protein CcdA